MKPKHEIPWRRHKERAALNRAADEYHQTMAAKADESRRLAGLSAQPQEHQVMQMIDKEASQTHNRLQNFLGRLRGKQ